MPFIDNAGGTSTADVINQAGDRVRGSLQGLYQQRAQDSEQNRLLHPATNKWLQKVMSGEMSAADAAVQAHAEIDANQNGIPDSQEMGMSGGKLVQAGEQGASGGMSQPQASLSPSSMQTLNSGMTGGVYDRPMTQRDLGDAQGIAKTATPYVKADASRDVANINKSGAGERSAAEIKYKEKALKDKGAQFDAMMAYRYEALKQDMREKGMQLESKERIASLERGGKQSTEILKKDMDTIDKMERRIVELQDEKVRAGTMLSPEQAAETDKMITDLKAELGHLKRSVHTEIRMMGGRPDETSDKAPGDQGGNYAPGGTYPPAGGGEGPAYTPGAAAQTPIDRSGRLPPGRGGQVGRSQSTAPDLNASKDVRTPKTIKVKSLETGEVFSIPASEVESDLQKMGPDRWLKIYAIDGVE